MRPSICIVFLGFYAILVTFAANAPFRKDMAFDKDVHFFFYLWYGNPEVDGVWKHWDHSVLPHWTEDINKKYAVKIGTHHSPPEILHSPYYPLKGPYSSRDSKVMLKQFDEMIQAGGTVAVISWWGQGNKKSSQDSQGINTDLLLHELFAVADTFRKIKIAFHLEPYPGRNIESICEDVVYIMNEYSHYQSFYKQSITKLPMFYIYDSYHLLPIHWSRLFHPLGDLTIRNTSYDGIFIGLWLDSHHGMDLLDDGSFDGIYTYFAIDSFSYGSTPTHWKSMCEYCHQHHLGRKICILSVGPGYNDTRIRPWNTASVRDRLDGKYFANMWDKAILAESDIISVTSFNEWGEGTQIEPAQEIVAQPKQQRRRRRRRDMVTLIKGEINHHNNDDNNDNDSGSNDSINNYGSNDNNSIDHTNDNNNNNNNHDSSSSNNNDNNNIDNNGDNNIYENDNDDDNDDDDDDDDMKVYQHYGVRGPYSYLHISAFYSQQFKEYDSLHRSQNVHFHSTIHSISINRNSNDDDDDDDDDFVGTRSSSTSGSTSSSSSTSSRSSSSSSSSNTRSRRNSRSSHSSDDIYKIKLPQFHPEVEADINNNDNSHTTTAHNNTNDNNNSHTTTSNNNDDNDITTNDDNDKSSAVTDVIAAINQQVEL